VESFPSLHLYQLAGLQLKELGRILDGVLEVSKVPNQVEVISGHVTNWKNLWSKTLLKLLRPLNIKFLLSCSRSSSKDVLKALNQVSQLQFCFQELRHRRLGGLRSARLMIIWGGVGDPNTVKLAARNIESWSLSRFLEPAVRNASRGTLKSTACDFVWHPHASTYPFPWPLPQDKLWLETTTAFHQDSLIIFSFTLHELGQIVDLSSDWLTALVQIVCKCKWRSPPTLSPSRDWYHWGSLVALSAIKS
jgi:hypothetical protein